MTINPETGTVYTRAELLTAFDSVTSNLSHWKEPIDIVVYGLDMRDVVTEAVVFFTGSVPTFTQDADGPVRVRAAGYYATIGA